MIKGILDMLTLSLQYASTFSTLINCVWTYDWDEFMMLQHIATLMEDTKRDLMFLLKDTDESIKEVVIHIIFKTSAPFRE